ncbi:uncharacterized protein [Asterias amurensis]|uniref:uncharacterized protein isoform X2 n=1 Tax=Asterias amurensis TaxID=7602 RepID=UPI003AB7ACDC
MIMEMGEGDPPCHLWHADLASDTAEKMLREYILKESPRFTRLERDLTECWECMEVYHKAREKIVSKMPQTGYYDRILLKLEEKRLKQSLGQEIDEEEVLVPIQEVTEHPFLLFNQEIASAFCIKLMELNRRIGLEAFLPQHVPSLYLLVIHPIKEVRELAWQCLQQPNHHITSDLYDDISPVLSWVLNLHIAGCLDQPMMEVISYNQSPSKVDILPRHLVCTSQSHIFYWQGVTRLFEIFSEEALKHRFMNSESHKQFIPVLIDTLSVHDEDSSSDSPFWWQLQCLTHLMDKLGSTVWQDISKAKIESFFNNIKMHPVFLMAPLNSGGSSIPVRRNPTIVTQSSLQVDPTEPIQWIIPYIKSLVDFGDSVSHIFCVVVTFLCMFSEQQSDSEAEARCHNLPGALNEKLMLALVRVLECLQKNSLLGTLVSKNGQETRQWLMALLTFLKQHPPVCSSSDLSRLVALSNESRQLLMDVFRSSKKHNRGQSFRYTKMLSLPSRLSAAKPGSSAAQNGDPKKLWEVNLKEEEFNDCVKFVEETLWGKPLSKQPMSTPVRNINPHRPKQLSVNTKYFSSSSSSSSESSESAQSPVAPSRTPCRSLADEFAKDLKPTKDELIGSQSSLEWEPFPEENEIFQISSDQESSDQESDRKERKFKVKYEIIASTSTSKADKGCSATYNLLSSGDDVALISDVRATGDSSSSLEDVFAAQSFQVKIQREEQQIKKEGGSPCVILERVPQLEELHRSIRQVRVTSINPLVIEKIEPNSTRPDWSSSSSNMETAEDLSSDLCESFERNAFLNGHRQQIKWKEEQDAEISIPSCSYQSTRYPSTPRQPFLSSSTSSLSGSPSPKSRDSSRKYPKNRLSRKKRNERRHVVANSSQDEDMTQISKPDMQEMKQLLKKEEDAIKETCDHQDQEFQTRDWDESRVVNPDIQEVKQSHKMEEDMKKETIDDQDQELVARDDSDEEMELSESSLSLHKDHTEGRRIPMIHSDEITRIAEVAPEDSASDEETQLPEEVSNLIADDNEDKVSTNLDSDDSECSESLLTQSYPPKDVPPPYSTESFNEDKPTTSQVVCNNHVSQDNQLGDKSTMSQANSSNHKSPDDQIEELTLISDSADEDIKPIPGFINLKRKSSFSSSYEDSSVLSFTEEHPEDDVVIDLESYNCSQLFDEDRFSQLTPCIEISSDSDIDLDAPEPELNIDLEAVKKEKEDSEEPDPGSNGGILLESQSEGFLDLALLQNDNDHDLMWCRDEDGDGDEDASNDGDDESAEDDVIDEAREGDEEDIDDEAEGGDEDSGDDVFLVEEVHTISSESQEEFPSTEQNDKLTAKAFYGKKPPLKRRFSDVFFIDREGDHDDFLDDQQPVPTSGRSGQGKEMAGLTWKSLEAEATGKIKKMVKRNKKKITQDKRRHAQHALKHATPHKGTLGVSGTGVDEPSTSRQRVAAPRAQGCWKSSRQLPPESTPTDAEPMKTIDSTKQPIVTDTFVLDNSQTYKRRKPSNQQDDKPRAAMQTVPSRFKSRMSILTQEIKKDNTGQREGTAKTRHFSGDQEVGASKVRPDLGAGPSRTRHASDPSRVGQTNTSLASLPSNSSIIDQLPTYAQSVYNNKSSIPPDVVSAAGKYVPNLPGATEPSCIDARQPSPSGESLSPISGPAFRFFTSDPQTMRTAATLSSNVASVNHKNIITTTQALHHIQSSTCEKTVTDNQPQTSRQPDQTSKPGGPLPPPAIEAHAKQGKENRQHPNTCQPLQQSKPYHEGMLASQGRPLQASEVSAKAGLVLRRKVTEDEFYCWVIGWDKHWLDSGHDRRPDPQILAECPYKIMKAVPFSFDSVEEYCQVFIPLLLHEVWAQIQNEVNSSSVVRALFVGVKHIESRQTGTLLSCTFRVTIPVGSCPVTCTDLLWISPSDSMAFRWRPLLAVVTNVVQLFPNSPSKLSANSSRPAELKSWDISVLVLARNEDTYSALLSTVKHNVDLAVIQSLSPYLRQFKALTSLANLGMIAKDILRFRRMDVFCPGPAIPIPDLESQKRLNKSQLKAVSAAFQAINQPDTLPRICLIQGPPGTGKTRAVIELVMKLLRSRHSQSGNRQPGNRAPKPPPILLCAPSNTAIDVLVRLIGCLINKDTPPTIVRVGRSHDIHHSIRKFGLESLVRSQRAKETSDLLFKQTKKKKEAELSQNRILELGKNSGLHKMRGEDREFFRVKTEQTNLIKQLKIVHSEIKDLQRRQAELDKKPHRHYEEYFMNKADIVCCTVNDCGSNVLQRSSNTDSKSKMMKFSCVIMDEANQCSELDSIISLQNSSMKVVLVGDTQSQPPSITSRIARHYGLHQSLFERLCHLSGRVKGTPSPVHYLQIQLRMHPEISQFPSKHFYGGRMVNDRKKAQMKEAFFLHPYLFFNVIQGQEVQTPSRNFTNVKEADMVLAVYYMICAEKARNQTMLKELMSVGVTTPYKEQAQLLHSRIMKTQENIKRSFVPEFVLPVIEISALDLFQGREKDVIILSCVRANRSPDQSSLGMIGDKRVLNVAITRARYSLFIIGHLPTLQTNSDWNVLAEDAHQRQLLIDVPLNQFKDAAQRCSKNIQELRSNTGNTTQMAPSVTLQAQTSQKADPSAVSAGLKSGPHKAVDPRIVGSKQGCSPQMLVDPRLTAGVSPSTSGDRGHNRGTNGVDTVGYSTGHRNSKLPGKKSNIASPAAKSSPFKKKRVRFKESSSQGMSEKAMQWSLIPKPMQPSSAAVKSPPKRSLYTPVFQKLKSQKTATYNSLGCKIPWKKQKGNQQSKPVVRVSHEAKRTRVQPAVAQAQPSPNKSSPCPGKTQNPTPVDPHPKIVEQSASLSSEVHQPSTSGSGQHGAAPNLQQTVEKITRNHANTKTTRPLHGLQQDPRQVRRQRIHDARTNESGTNEPVRIPYSGREHAAPFD